MKRSFTEIFSGHTTSRWIVVATVTKSQSPNVEKTRGWPRNTNDRITRPRLTSHEKARKILYNALSGDPPNESSIFYLLRCSRESLKLITYINWFDQKFIFSSTWERSFIIICDRCLIIYYITLYWYFPCEIYIHATVCQFLRVKNCRR